MILDENLNPQKIEVLEMINIWVNTRDFRWLSFVKSAITIINYSRENE